MTRKASHQPSCAAFWLRAVAEALESEGLDLQALFAEAGLELAALKDPDARFPNDNVSLLWQLAVASSGILHSDWPSHRSRSRQASMWSPTR